MGSRVLFAFFFALAVAAAPDAAAAAAAQRPAPECHDPATCRTLALQARELRQYERFHDLAWRAVQTGPPNDPSLMYLLARAQSLSNRGRDAILMLRRLGERGVVTEAATDPDFDVARRLPGWSDLEALMARVAAAAADRAALASDAFDPTPAAGVEPPALTPPAPAVAAIPPPAPPAPAPSPPAAPAASPPPAAAPPAVKPAAPKPAPPSPVRFDVRPSEEAARFPARSLVAGGLAYDAVSGRFLVGDSPGRRVIVVADGAEASVDLVRAASAGFLDVASFAIDTRRGDLWVVSREADSSASAVHRVQLISGRPLATVALASDSSPVAAVDVAVAPGGMVFVLDGAGPRVFGIRAGGKEADAVMALDVAAPSSLTMADDRTAYVAHAAGIARLDLQTRRAAAVRAPDGITLGQFEWLRWHRSSLVGVQRLPDASRRLVQLSLNRAGDVSAATVFGPALDGNGVDAFAAVSGDFAYYLTRNEAAAQVVVRRVRLP